MTDTKDTKTPGRAAFEAAFPDDAAHWANEDPAYWDRVAQAAIDQATEEIDIVFDTDASIPSSAGYFVEVELRDGSDIDVGEWVHDHDEYTRLRMRVVTAARKL